MAIAHISIGDEESVSKINQAIDKVNEWENGKIDNEIGSGRVLGRTSADIGPVGSLVVTGGLEAVSGDLRIANEGVTAAKLGPNSATNAKLAQMATQTFKGRLTTGTGNPEDLSVAQMKDALGINGKIDNAIASGCVLGRSSADTGPVGSLNVTGGLEAIAGDLRIANEGVTGAKLASRSVLNHKMADVPSQTFKGRLSADEGSPEDLSVSQMKDALGITALAEGLSTESNARAQAVFNEAEVRAEADRSEASERKAADEARPTYGRIHGAIRPGEAISYFTDKLDGEAESLSPLPASSAVASQFGKVAKLVGAGTLAPISAWRIEPGHLYRVRFVVRRSIDTDDPANDAVRLGIRWLKSDKSGLATTELANLLDVTVADGRLEYVYTLATVAADEVDAAPPPTGIYFRPFVRTFGGGETHVEVVQVVDATDAVVWSPDVEILLRTIAALTAQVQTLADRVTTLEA